MKKILLISTGGTISQVHTDEGIAISNENSVTGDTFVNALNNLRIKLGIDKIDAKNILNKDSSNICPKDWQLIVNTIVDNYDDYDAFVVTHGTNTMGYTCAAVSFALQNLGKPVVFTGAQVSYGIPGTDALMNLENVFRVIVEHEELVGVFLVFGSKIITGTRVKKTTEYEYDAFKTFGRLKDIGNVGNSVHINNDMLESHLSFLENKAKTKNELTVKNKFDENIISLTEFPGLQSKYIKSLVDSGVKGIIIRGTGAGDLNVTNDILSDDFSSALRYLKEKNIPIIVTTQAPDGVASMNINEPGQIAKKLNAIPSWDMSIESMTTKLAWLIAQNKNYEEIRNMMITSIKGEINCE